MDSIIDISSCIPWAFSGLNPFMIGFCCKNGGQGLDLGVKVAWPQPSIWIFKIQIQGRGRVTSILNLIPRFNPGRNSKILHDLGWNLTLNQMGLDKTKNMACWWLVHHYRSLTLEGRKGSYARRLIKDKVISISALKYKYKFYNDSSINFHLILKNNTNLVQYCHQPSHSYFHLDCHHVDHPLPPRLSLFAIIELLVGRSGGVERQGEDENGETRWL